MSLAYRNVRKAARIAFKGDDFAYKSALQRIRLEFEKGRLIVDENERQKMLKTANQVAHILRHNIVQGQRVDEEKGSLKYRLNIDPNRHELGDNESRFGKAKSTPEPCGCTTCIE